MPPPPHFAIQSASPIRDSTILSVMANPLSPLSSSRLNRDSPASPVKWRENHISPKNALNSQDENNPLDIPARPSSSPFIADVSLSAHKFETPSISAKRSPKKEHMSFKPLALTEEALREKEASANDIKCLDERNIDPSIRHASEDETISTAGGVTGFPGMDDTCFSAFSAVPNADMTRFANLGQSPTKTFSRNPEKQYGDSDFTPRPPSWNTPSRNNEHYSRSNFSPTPRRSREHHGDDTTNLLVDFTDQFSITQTTNRPLNKYARTSPLKSQSSKDLPKNAHSRQTPSPSKYPLPPGTPSEARHLANLLDFDLPPAPTPRSIPSITARELESMKSSFLSQISSLTATLSGREAEVKALSDAVKDAERRVGEALEQIRNERSMKEGLQHEKDDLERRQSDMQKVLKDVKDEIIAGDREKDALLQRVQEADHKREEAEVRLVEAESKLEGMKSRSPESSTSTQVEKGNSQNVEVEAAVTKVARELHGLYKSKHEAKVTALKKSYSDRWEKKVRELQLKIEEISRENDDLRVGRDATISGVVPGTTVSSVAESENAKIEREAEKNRYDEKVQRLQSLENDLEQVRKQLAFAGSEKENLQLQLSASRTEIDELVAATEELMLLSQSAAAPMNFIASDSQPTTSTSQDIKSSLSRSVSGSSALKAPGFGGGTLGSDSKIGKAGVNYNSNHSRDRSGSGLGTRSGIMSNIERMGRGRVAD